MKKLKSYRLAALFSILAGTTFLTASAKDADVKDGRQMLTNASLLFVENKGQIADQFDKPRKDIDFKLNATNVNVFIGDGAIHYQWTKSKGSEALKKDNFKIPILKNEKTETYRLDVVLVGANINAPIVQEEKQAYYENYYLAQCPGGLSAGSCKKVTYKNIYPNIDWVLYTSSGPAQGGLKYDFVVHPGGNPADIQIRYEGATDINLQEGALVATTPMGSITEEKPYSYYADSKEEIASSFILNDNVLTFDIPRQDKTMVIDPQLNWATYVGFTGADYATNVAADGNGAGYIVGWTNGSNTASFLGHQYTYGGGTEDGFVAKFAASGALDWLTYYGGSGADQVSDIACDATGNIYFTGVTISTNAISTPGTHQTVHGSTGSGYGAYDVFIAKFSGSGARVWGTYLGDSLEDVANAIACDKDGNVYVGGHTDSKRSIATTGAFKTTHGGAFLAKFNQGGARLWATYYGDSGWTHISSIACDMKGNVYCGGSTSSYTNISTSGSHQSQNGGGTTGPLAYEDGFLVKFNTFGQRQWATFYGGNNFDMVNAVACDERGGVYIGGKTQSVNGTSIATTGSHQPALVTGITCSPGPRSDGFIAKFNEQGIRQWATYHGTTWHDDVTDIKVLPGSAFLYVASTRYIDSPCFGFPPPGQCYFARFTHTGKKTWQADTVCTYLNSEIAYGKGKLYFSGSNSDPGKATTGANKTYISGPIDGYLQQYFADTLAFIALPFNDTVLCIGDTLRVPYDVTNKFNTGNVITLQMSNTSGSFANATTLTTVTTDTGGTIKYLLPNTLTPGNGYRLRLISSNPVDTSLDNYADLRISEYPNVGPVAIFPICANGTLQLSDTGTSPFSTTYTWTGPGGFTVGAQMYNRPNVQITDSGYYVLEGDNYGCKNKDSVHVLIYAKPAKPVFSNNSPVCDGDTVKLSLTSSTPGITKYTWAFYQGTTGVPIWYKPEVSADTVIVNATFSDTGRYVAVAIAGGCPSDPETTKVVVNSKASPTVQIGANPGVIVGPWLDVTFTVTGNSNPGATPTYQWTKNGIDIPNATGLTYTATTAVGLQTGDTICVRMLSSEQCAIPSTALNCMIVTIDLGIDDVANDVLELYPNPNNGHFMLKSNTVFAKEEFAILNSLGQIVHKGQLPSGQKTAEINTGHMPAGMYMLRIKSGTQSMTKRFTIDN